MKGRRLFEILNERSELTRAARQKIDSDIYQLYLKIHFLRRKRNELSPISVLPPEVISKIFISVRDSLDRSNHDQTQWIRVGHVCHHWREVALGCPSLWSVPVFAKPDLAQEMMRRSKMAALTITSTSNPWTPRMLTQLKNAMAQVSRIRSIYFVLGDHQWYPGNLKVAFSSLSRPTPLLENITLAAGCRGDFSLAEDTLSYAPLLRSIDLGQLDFSWGSAIFKHRNLTELRLKDSRIVTSGTSTFGQMMGALRQLPNLRILELTNSIPSHTTSSRNEEILEFKLLEQLILGAKPLDCISFLRHIRYPSGAAVKLHCPSTGAEDRTTTLSFIGGQCLLRTPSVEAGTYQFPVIIRSAQLTSPCAGVTEIMLFDKAKGVGRASTSSDGCFNPVIHICFEGPRITSQEHGRLLMDFYNFFDLSSLEALFMDWSFTCDQIRVILDSLGRLPRLNFIHVSQFLPELLCLALTETTEGPEETKPLYPLHTEKPQHALPPVIAFPALRTLLIESMDFRQLLYPENIGNLVDMLMMRVNVGMPIDKLSLKNCPGVWTWQKRRLGELVVDFEVDGTQVDVKELGSDGDQWHSEDYGSSDEEYGGRDNYYDDYDSYDNNGFYFE